MSNPPDPAEESLHEFIDFSAHFQSNDPAKEREVLDKLTGVPGVRNCAISGGKIFITYDPVTVTREEILDVIRAAGGGVDDIASSASSPVADALDEVVLPHPPPDEHHDRA